MLPANLDKLTGENIDDILAFYGKDLHSPQYFRQEIKLWKREWTSTEIDRSNEILETLKFMDVHFYPNIAQVLRLTLTLPVSAASVERSHSALKQIKTKKRSTMSGDRLNAL